MDLTEEEKAEVKGCLDRGEPLPDSYRFRLFREPRETELIWPGKTHEVTQAILPFQSIEQIDEPRAETSGGGAMLDLFSRDAGGRQAGGWSNKLIWGDNKLVLSSLKGGPLRREIEKAGGLKLVYIDPPFDVGADFSFDVEVGQDTLVKQASVIEDIAYRDTWGRGADSFATMISERIKIIADLLHNDGAIFVHCDTRVSAILRSCLDDCMSMMVNEIVWKRRTGFMGTYNKLGATTDTLFWYSKSSDYIFNEQYGVSDPEYLERFKFKDENGRLYRTDNLTSPNPRPNLKYVYKGFLPPDNGWAVSLERMQKMDAEGRLEFPRKPTGRIQRRRFLDELQGQPIQNLWTDIYPINPMAGEAIGYPTQKPETLLERVLGLASNPGDLIADFFCGSGTTLAVAEKLGRKWIGCDLGRFAIHTSRKRLIGVQRQLKAEGKPYRAFEILNLGKYERQWFAGIDPTLPEVQRRAVAAAKEARYVELILTAYGAQPAEQSPPFHGRKGSTFVLVGPVDAPVTESQVADAVDASRRMGVGRVDVLGFEFEMGLAPRLVDEAKAKGVAVALRYIPKDVFDRRAVEKGQVVFHDLAFVEAKAAVTDKRARRVAVSLTNFGVSYRQEDVEALTAAMKAGSRVTVDGGQVVKIMKAKSGEVTREVLTKSWMDWIDYWAVDFDYASRPETIVVTEADASGCMVERPQWTGGYIFENEWQAFRTRKDRALELISATHDYSRAGRYRIAVKVIDIFGNDTTKVIGVEV